MIYIIVPHNVNTWENLRIFMNYSAAEQAVLNSARGFLREGRNPDWCYLVAYDGADEVYPVFLYVLEGARHLKRYPYPTPSP